MKKNNFLFFPFARIALINKNKNNGVAENAYKIRSVFIGILYHFFVGDFLFLLEYILYV